MDDFAAREEQVGELEDVKSELEEIVRTILKLEDGIPGSTGERLRQVRAQLETLISKDHGWMGGSMYTLQDVINELNEDDDCDEEE